MNHHLDRLWAKELSGMEVKHWRIFLRQCKVIFRNQSFCQFRLIIGLIDGGCRKWESFQRACWGAGTHEKCYTDGNKSKPGLFGRVLYHRHSHIERKPIERFNVTADCLGQVWCQPDSIGSCSLLYRIQSLKFNREDQGSPTYKTEKPWISILSWRWLWRKNWGRWSLADPDIPYLCKASTLKSGNQCGNTLKLDQIIDRVFIV